MQGILFIFFLVVDTPLALICRSGGVAQPPPPTHLKIVFSLLFNM